MGERGIPQMSPTIILTDSKGNYESMKTPITTKLRHVNMRFHRVRQAILDKDVIFHLTRSEDMLADLFTKNFCTDAFVRLRELCMGYGDKPNLPKELLDILIDPRLTEPRGGVKS